MLVASCNHLGNINEIWNYERLLLTGPRARKTELATFVRATRVNLSKAVEKERMLRTCRDANNRRTHCILLEKHLLRLVKISGCGWYPNCAITCLSPWKHITWKSINDGMISSTAYIGNLGYLLIFGKWLNKHRRILGSQFLVTDPQLSILITTHAVDEIVLSDQSSMLKSTWDLPYENAIGAVFGSWL